MTVFHVINTTKLTVLDWNEVIINAIIYENLIDGEAVP